MLGRKNCVPNLRDRVKTTPCGALYISKLTLSRTRQEGGIVSVGVYFESKRRRTFGCLIRNLLPDSRTTLGGRITDMPAGFSEQPRPRNTRIT